MINNHLTHRCTITRRTEKIVDGAPRYIYETVGTNVPCLWSADRSEKTPFWATNADVASGMIGQLFVGPKVDVKPQDTVIITRPVNGPTLTIQTAAPKIFDHRKLNHLQFVAKQVAGTN